MSPFPMPIEGLIGGRVSLNSGGFVPLNSGGITVLVLIKLTKFAVALRLRCGSCKLIF